MTTNNNTKDKDTAITPVYRSENSKNDRQITPEKVRKLLDKIDLFCFPFISTDGCGSPILDPDDRVLCEAAPAIAQAYLDKYAELASETQRKERLQESLEHVYKPCFTTVMHYVWGKLSEWPGKYLGLACHDVIVDRCEELEKAIELLKEESKVLSDAMSERDLAIIEQEYHKYNARLEAEIQRLQAIIEKQRELWKKYNGFLHYDDMRYEFEDAMTKALAASEPVSNPDKLDE